MAKSLSARVETLERNALRHDKQLQTIRNLIEQGMRMVVRMGGEQRKLQASVAELTSSLKRGANGHAKRKVDLQ